MLDLIRVNSLWPLLSGLACCAIEMMSAATSVNDMDRFNMFPFRASPRQADVLIVAGTLTTKMAGPLVRLWEQMPEPKWCVAMGDCTCSGGRYKRSYATVEGIDRVMPVDVYVPGLPAAPGGPDLRDDEAAAAHPRAARPLGRAGRRPDRPGRRLTGTEAAQPKEPRPRTPRSSAASESALGPPPGRAVSARHDTTEIRVTPAAPGVTQVMRTLHDDPDLRFEFLADLAGVDTGTAMQVVYHLWSETTPDWLRVIADGLSRDDPRVPSVTFLWKGAEWMEREAYDMFGIIFEGNRDLRRIYMPPDYQSFPLRKDFLLPDDAARSPGMGVRHMEQAFAPGRDRPQPVLRPARAPVRPVMPPAPTAATRPGGRPHRRPRDAPPAVTAPTRIRSLDDPDIMVETPATIYDAIPPYPPRTEREAEFYTCATARCSSTSGRSTPPRTACCASSSRSTASAWSTWTRCSATSTAASRRSARTATGTTPSATATRSSTSPRCSARRCRSSPRRSCSTWRCHGAPSTSASWPGSSTGSPATRCSSAGWRSTWAA